LTLLVRKLLALLGLVLWTAEEDCWNKRTQM